MMSPIITFKSPVVGFGSTNSPKSSLESMNSNSSLSDLVVTTSGWSNSPKSSFDSFVTNNCF
jgi:hypothetical protein